MFDNLSDRGIAFFRSLVVVHPVVLGSGPAGPEGPQGEQGPAGPEGGDATRAEAYCAVVFASAHNANLPDSLVVSALAALLPAPVVGVWTTEDPADLWAEVGHGNHAIIAGGTAAVPQSFEDGLVAAGVDVVRLGGAERTETSRLIADYGASFLAGDTRTNDHC